MVTAGAIGATFGESGPIGADFRAAAE